MELKETRVEIPEPKGDKDDKPRNGANDQTIKTDSDEIGHQSDEKHPIERYIAKIKDYKNRYHKKIIIVRNVVLLFAYFVYFGYAVSYHVGDENSWRLIGFTIFGTFLLFWRLLKKTAFGPKWTSFMVWLVKAHNTGRRARFIRCFVQSSHVIYRWKQSFQDVSNHIPHDRIRQEWNETFQTVIFAGFYVAMTAFMVGYVIVSIATKFPQNLRSLMGLVVFPIILTCYSKHKTKINWHTVFWGMAIQFIMALLILKTTWGASIISWMGTRLTEFVGNAKAGSVFIFGEDYTHHMFVFGSMVQGMLLIIGISVLTYLGVVTFIVETLGRALAFMLQVSPAEGINSVGNIFLHVPESVLLVQQYVVQMTPSQFFVTYAGGLTTVGGVALIIFMASGVPAAPLIAASAMSAPAALAASKIVYPSLKDEKAPTPPEKPTLLRTADSLADSVIIGINQGVSMVVQVVAFLLSFIIILEFANNVFIWFGERVGVSGFSVEFVFSYLFYPFAYLMGARADDCLFIGSLLGTRTFGLAVITYPKLGPIIQNGIEFRKYVSESVNNTWVAKGSDIFLEQTNQTLVGGVIEARSEVIATYALCGSASIAVMGLIIGSYGVLIPYRQKEITQNIFRAFIVGTFASYLTACFAGLLFEEGVGYE